MHVYIYFPHHYCYYFLPCYNVTIREETNCQSKDPGASVRERMVSTLYRVVACAHQIGLCLPKPPDYYLDDRAVEGAYLQLFALFIRAMKRKGWCEGTQHGCQGRRIHVQNNHKIWKENITWKNFKIVPNKIMLKIWSGFMSCSKRNMCRIFVNTVIKVPIP
jgi:hypothetical protein